MIMIVIQYIELIIQEFAMLGYILTAATRGAFDMLLENLAGLI